MQLLLTHAERAAGLLKDRRETIVVAESSAGGLISASLLACPGASAYFLGSAVLYTRQSRSIFLDISDSALAGTRPASEPYALLLARTARSRFSASWGSPKQAPPVRLVTATVIRPVTRALRSLALPNRRSRSKPDALIGLTTCVHSRQRH